MKLFKSSKKKDGEKKSKSSLFGKSKKSVGSNKNLVQQQDKQNPTDAESSSFTSHTDTVTTAMSPRWLNNNGTVNSRSSALSYHEQVLGGGDRSHNDPIDDIGYKNSNTSSGKPQNNPFGESDAHVNSHSFSSSESEGSDMDHMESSTDALRPILEYLEEKERREWADDLNDSPRQSDTAAEKEELDEMLRKAVDRMDVNLNNVEVQRIGTRIVYLVSKLRKRNTIDSNHNEANAECWYADDKATAQRSNHSSLYDEDDEELITDALDAILQAMEDFPDDEVLIENACCALEATSEKRNIHVNAKRILEEVLMAIEGFADNHSVVSSSMGILYNLSSSSNENPTNTRSNKEHSNDELRRKLAKYALPSILQGMKEHRDDLELYTKGCKAMVNFTMDDPNAQQILACKESLGLRVISEGMKYWQADKLDEFAVLQHLRLRLAAIRVLKNLSTHISLEVKGKIALGGGAARIMDRLLEALVFTGKDLVANNYQVGELSTNIEVEDLWNEEDEVELCLAIMRDALETIGNLANIESVIKDDPRSPHMPTIYRSATVDNSSAETIQKQLTKAVKPVVNIIRQHPNRPSLQYHGLTCVKKLAISHADSIADQGGISTFLNLLSSSGVASVNESMIREKALSCLTGLLSPSSNADGLDLVASMETEDGLDTIFRTIRRYQSDTAVIETAYEALFYLSCRVRVVLSSIEGRHHSISNGVGANSAQRLESQLCLEENIFVMLGTLNQYFQVSESISQRGMGLLVNVHAFLTRTQAQHREPDILVSDGGIRLVLVVMRRHGLAVAIQEYGVGLLAGILRSATSYDAIRREFVDEEGLSTVLSAMMIHPDHAAVQSHGCDVLIQLMAIDKHPMENGYSETAGFSAYYKKCILEETNAVMVVQDSMQRFRSHKGVTHYASILLKELSKATAVTPLSALPSKLQSSIRSSTSKISSSIRSSLE